MINILFFAQIRERLDCASLQLENVPATLKELRDKLSSKSELWAEILQSQAAIAAVNQTISGDDTALKDGDEVAFFPPVTGG